MIAEKVERLRDSFTRMMSIIFFFFQNLWLQSLMGCYKILKHRFTIILIIIIIIIGVKTRLRLVSHLSSFAILMETEVFSAIELAK